MRVMIETMGVLDGLRAKPTRSRRILLDELGRHPTGRAKVLNVALRSRDLEWLVRTKANSSLDCGLGMQMLVSCRSGKLSGAED